MDKIEQKYVVIEISDEQLVMMIETDFNLMVENNAQEGIEGYIKRFEGNCIECSDYIFNKGKDSVEIKRIQEMESDLAYMKDHGEHGSSCVGCAAEQNDVTCAPCNACKEYNLYHPKNKSIPTDPETLDNTIESQFPNDFEEKQTDFMNDVCGSLKETFSNIKTVHPFPSWIDPKTWEIMQKMHNSQFVSTEPHIKVIIDYLWSDELRHFCEGFGVEIQSQDDLDNWIKVCENDNNPEKEAMTDHVFYHLMKLKQLYNL